MLEGIQRVAHRRIADRVNVYLKPLRIECRDQRVELLRRDVGMPAKVWTIGVRLEQGRGVVVDQAIATDLHARRPEALPAELLAQADHTSHIVESICGVDAQSGDRPDRQLAA